MSRLIERVARGESILIAKAGRPIAKLVPLETPPARERRRTGFLAGEFRIPEDFDRMDMHQAGPESDEA